MDGGNNGSCRRIHTHESVLAASTTVLASTGEDIDEHDQEAYSRVHDSCCMILRRLQV